MGGEGRGGDQERGGGRAQSRGGGEGGREESGGGKGVDWGLREGAIAGEGRG